MGWADAETLAPTFEEVERAIGVTRRGRIRRRRTRCCSRRASRRWGSRATSSRATRRRASAAASASSAARWGFKGSVDRNLIPFSLQSGAALFPCTRAVSLIVENGAAVGVEAYGVDPLTEERKRKLTFRAKKVFLCGGAIGSPMFLLRTGQCNGRAHTLNVIPFLPQFPR